MEMNHVLIVEDDKEIREGVEIYLKSQGYVVFQAADGVEGLEVIEDKDDADTFGFMVSKFNAKTTTVKLGQKFWPEYRLCIEKALNYNHNHLL